MTTGEGSELVRRPDGPTRATLLQMASAETRGQAARLAPYTHLVMLAGVVCTAASFDLVVARPTGETPARWVALVFGGPALFLIGRAVFTYQVSRRVPWHRLVWLLVLAVAAPWAVGWPPVLVAAVTSVALAALVATDAISGRRGHRSSRQVLTRAGARGIAAGHDPNLAGSTPVPLV